MPDYSVAQFHALELEIACLQREVERLTAAWHAEMETEAELRREVERLRGGLRGIRREFGHHSINNGTSSLGIFIDALLANDVEYARQMERDKGIY